MKKITFLSVVFGSILLLFGCEKEPDIKNIQKENPKFTLSISPETDTVVVGEKVPVTIRTEGGDSVTFRSNETDTVHSYSRPIGLTGFWVIIDTLYVNSEGSNVAHIAAFQFIEGLDDPIVKNGQSSIVGCYPDLQVSADPSQIPWRTSALITIKTFGCDSLWTDIEGWNGSFNGTFETALLDSSKTYHVFAYKYGEIMKSDSVTINVNAPTFMDFITAHPWSILTAIVSCECDEDGPWFPASISQEQRDTKWFFKKDGKWEAYRYGVLIGGPGPFSITDSIMNWGGGIYEINVLDFETMSLRHNDELSIGCPGNIGCAIRTYGPSAPD